MVISRLFFFQAEDGIRDLVRSRGLGDVYKRQDHGDSGGEVTEHLAEAGGIKGARRIGLDGIGHLGLSLIHI